MKLEITDEMMSFFTQSYKEKAYDSLKGMIDYCRERQRKYKEEGGMESGVTFLAALLMQGYIKPDLHFKMLIAVENYKTPYEINLIK